MANCVQCGRQLPGLTFGKKLCQWCVQHEAAQRGEDSPVQRIEPAPWTRSQSSSMPVTQAILAINVMVFIAMALAKVSITEPSLNDLLRWGANFGPYTIAGQWWRLLTCVFVHIGIIHIALNMWCLWGLGRLAESIYDHWTYAGVYLITGVSASVGSLLWDPARLSAGASGAIFGIAGALISSLYLGEFNIPKTSVSAMLQSVVRFAGINLVFGAMAGHTDNAAHVGGLVSGLILGALIAKVAPNKDDFPRRACVLLIGIALAFGGAAWLQRSDGYIVHAANGHKLLAEKKTDQAIVELQSAIRQRPGYVEGHYELARAYWIKGDLPSAQRELTTLAAVYEAKGMHREAEQARQLAKQLQDQNPNANQN